MIGTAEQRHGVRSCEELRGAAGLFATPSIVRAQTPQVMKIGTPTLNDDQHEWMKIFAALVEKGSSGAIKAELYPASQLGLGPADDRGSASSALYAGRGHAAGVSQRGGQPLSSARRAGSFQGSGSCPIEMSSRAGVQQGVPISRRR